MSTRRKSPNKKVQKTSPISIINPNAAGIDIGDTTQKDISSSRRHGLSGDNGNET